MATNQNSVFKIDQRDPLYQQYKEGILKALEEMGDDEELNPGKYIFVNPHCLLHLVPDCVVNINLTEEQQLNLLFGMEVEIGDDKRLWLEITTGRLNLGTDMGKSQHWEVLESSQCIFNDRNKHLMFINNLDIQFEAFKREYETALKNDSPYSFPPRDLIKLIPDTIQQYQLNDDKKFEMIAKLHNIQEDGKVIFLNPFSGQLTISETPVVKMSELSVETQRPIFRADCRFNYENSLQNKEQLKKQNAKFKGKDLDQSP
jgi:hypothetical protein